MKSTALFCVCVLANPLPTDRDPLAVYANNELKLSEIDVYGFDYDYTVACYNDSLNRLIYDMGRANLMQFNKAGFYIYICFCLLRALVQNCNTSCIWYTRCDILLVNALTDGFFHPTFYL